MGPLMVLKHFAPLLKASDTETAASGETSQAPKATAVFYSARVGSIGDNATGGSCTQRSTQNMKHVHALNVPKLPGPCQVDGTPTAAARRP